jgi:hypothetical protein
LHLSRYERSFLSSFCRNAGENSELQRGQGRALHLSRFSRKLLI